MKIASSRAIIASTQRVTPYSIANLIRSRRPGSGIWSQTLDAYQYDFEGPIVGQRDEATGVSLFFVQSEKFADRYYIICERANGYWYFSGDEKLREHYLAKVQAMLQAQEVEEAAEQPVEEVAAPVAEQTFIAPIFNGPWHGAIVHISDKEMAELKARVKARKFAKVCADVRTIEQRYRLGVA